MSRLRRWSVVVSVVATAWVFQPVGRGQPSGKSTAEKWFVDRSLTVTPQAAPAPAFKYRLFPSAGELRDGNAVPIYLRLNHEQTDQARKHWTETPQKWNELPLDQVPLAEAHKFLDGVRKRFLEQFDAGARRRTAEWNYTLELPDPISILIPDAAMMRGYAPMLVLDARVRIADGDYAGAARAFQTGIAFGRHVADGPFLISSLVGLSVVSQMVDRVPEWIERPGSPNLYWALTALPRPLVDMRPQYDLEQRVIEWQFPDLAASELSRPRSAAEWDAALKRFRAEVKRIDALNQGSEAEKATGHTPPVDPDEAAEKSAELASARKYVAAHSGRPDAEVTAMPPAQVLLLYVAGTYRDLQDDTFKITYLPYPQAHARLAEVDRLRSAAGGEGGRLAKMFLPAIGKSLTRNVGLERKIALLRAVEAVRLHAAEHGGQLPESLDQVTVVPVPLDPGTGKPFEYLRDGATVTLTSRIPGEPLESTGLRYRVTIRQ